MRELTTDVWSVREEEYPGDAPLAERARFLLRYAILAPSTHNTQPWRFAVDGNRIEVRADTSRWLEVADADRRELYLSVGCAIENLVVAADHFGLGAPITLTADDGDPEFAAVVRLEESPEPSSPALPPDLFRAITERHTNHRLYEDRPVPLEVRARLVSVERDAGIGIHFTDDPAVRRKVDELTVRADAIQFADPEWRHELGYWLGRGVFGQGWLLSKVARLAVSHLDFSRRTARKDAELLDSAPLLGLVTAPDRSRASSLRAGRAFQRVALTATAAGLVLQPMNQILQIGEVREGFEDLLPDGWAEPQITFRLGYADPEGHTPRWPLEAVVEGDAEPSPG